MNQKIVVWTPSDVPWLINETGKKRRDLRNALMAHDRNRILSIRETINNMTYILQGIQDQQILRGDQNPKDLDLPAYITPQRGRPQTLYFQRDFGCMNPRITVWNATVIQINERSSIWLGITYNCHMDRFNIVKGIGGRHSKPRDWMTAEGSVRWSEEYQDWLYSPDHSCEWNDYAPLSLYLWLAGFGKTSEKPAKQEQAITETQSVTDRPVGEIEQLRAENKRLRGVIHNIAENAEKIEPLQAVWFAEAVQKVCQVALERIPETNMWTKIKEVTHE